MPRTKRDMVIAVCPVAPAHAIRDRDRGRDENLERETEAAAALPIVLSFPVLLRIPDKKLPLPDLR